MEIDEDISDKLNREEVDSDSKVPQSSFIREGTAEILNEGNVFYNPVQQFNRDLSISVISTFSNLYKLELDKNQEKLHTRNQKKIENSGNNESGESEINETNAETGLYILEALSATGLRSIRYAKEVPGVRKIIANDLCRQAVDAISKNLKHNQVEHLVEPRLADAMTLMYTSTAPDRQFTVIDLDPYGSPSRFLDGAVQSLVDGGLLLITATDMAVFAGGTPEACLAKYGAVPLKSRSCHEMALRILLRTIETTATRYGRYIHPLLSISADFYIRVFLRIFTSPLACKRSSSKQSMVFQCTGCDSITLQPLGITKPNPSPKNPNQVKFMTPTGPFVNTNCQHCQQKHHMGGPIWSDPIHDSTFIAALLDTIQKDPFTKLGTHSRLTGMLTVIQEELLDVPLYYAVDRMCSIVKLEVIPILTFRSAILHAGYRVSFSHACKSSIKSDAPAAVLWDILRCWAKIHPVKQERFDNNLPLKAILSREPAKEYDLVNIHEMSNPISRKIGLARFPENPAAHWGPGTRATLMIGDRMMKSVKNQNKHGNKKKRQQSEDGDGSGDGGDRHGSGGLKRNEYLARLKLAKIE